jgi:hypothetical protein
MYKYNSCIHITSNKQLKKKQDYNIPNKVDFHYELRNIYSDQ